MCASDVLAGESPPPIDPADEKRYSLIYEQLRRESIDRSADQSEVFRWTTNVAHWRSDTRDTGDILSYFQEAEDMEETTGDVRDALKEPPPPTDLEALETKIAGTSESIENLTAMISG